MVVCTGQVWDVELGTRGSAGFVPPLPRVAEDHHNSDVGREWLSRACRSHGQVLQHMPQSHGRWRQGNSLSECSSIPTRQTLFVASWKRDKQSGLQTWGWGDGGMGSRARRGAQPEPVSSRWQPQGFHGLPWILFSTPRLKISLQGKMERKFCGRLCYVSSWLFP